MAAANPARSVVQPPPRATIVPPRSSRSSLQSLPRTADGLRPLAGRHLVLAREAARREPPVLGRRRCPSRCCRRRARPARRRERARRDGRARRARSARRRPPGRCRPRRARPRLRPRGRSEPGSRRAGGTAPRRRQAAGASVSPAPRQASRSASTSDDERPFEELPHVSGIVTAPPPRAITDGSLEASARRASCSACAPRSGTRPRRAREELAGSSSAGPLLDHPVEIEERPREPPGRPPVRTSSCRRP